VVRCDVGEGYALVADHGDCETIIVTLASGLYCSLPEAAVGARRGLERETPSRGVVVPAG
jgi:hypothetical protein